MGISRGFPGGFLEEERKLEIPTFPTLLGNPQVTPMQWGFPGGFLMLQLWRSTRYVSHDVFYRALQLLHKAKIFSNLIQMEVNQI